MYDAHMSLEVTAQSHLPDEISDQQWNWFQITENGALLKTSYQSEGRDQASCAADILRCDDRNYG
jgi:hypothetical protein